MAYFVRGVFAMILCVALLASPKRAQADRDVAWIAGDAQAVQLRPVATKLAPGLVTAQLTVEPQPTVTRYSNCNNIKSPAYVSSITAMQWYSRNHWVDESDPDVAAGSWAIARVGTPGQAPVQPQARPGPPTYPKTPFPRIRPDNPFVCLFGRATVRPLIGVVRPPEKVKLVVASMVLNRNMGSVVEDTYELPGAGSQPVTFTNIAVRALWVGFDPATGQAIMDDFHWRNKSNGTLVGYQTFYKDAPGKRVPCILKSDANSQGPSAISCPPGTKWPI